MNGQRKMKDGNLSEYGKAKEQIRDGIRGLQKLGLSDRDVLDLIDICWREVEQ